MQEKLEVRVKKLSKDAIIPKIAKDGDAGMDLTAIDKIELHDNYVKYNFGLAFEIPNGYVGYIFPRSSVFKYDQLLSNCVGVIDSGYRGEVSAVMIGNTDRGYEIGDRICQIVIMPIPKINFVEVKELSKTERGSGGFGSTGNNKLN